MEIPTFAQRFTLLWRALPRLRAEILRSLAKSKSRSPPGDTPAINTSIETKDKRHMASRRVSVCDRGCEWLNAVSRLGFSLRVHACGMVRGLLRSGVGRRSEKKGFCETLFPFRSGRCRHFVHPLSPTAPTPSCLFHSKAAPRRPSPDGPGFTAGAQPPSRRMLHTSSTSYSPPSPAQRLRAREPAGP